MNIPQLRQCHMQHDIFRLRCRYAWTGGSNIYYIYICHSIPYYQTRWVICTVLTTRSSLHKARHSVVQYVAMVRASTNIAPINVCKDLCPIHIRHSICCPIVGTMYTDCDYIVVSIALIHIVRAEHIAVGSTYWANLSGVQPNASSKNKIHGPHITSVWMETPGNISRVSWYQSTWLQ